jgi:hypothetical protein
MSQEPTLHSNTNYLRPEQVREMKDEATSIDETLANPVTRALIDDPGEMVRTRQRLEKQIETQSPPKLSPEDRDAAARELGEVTDRIREGMPTAEEMRKMPPGAIGKHRSWESRHKDDVLRYKRLQIMLNPESTDPDLCNIEKLRPRSNTLNLDNALIPGSEVYLPNGPVRSSNHASDEDRDRWDRELKEMQDRERAHRQEIETLRAQIAESEKPPEKKPRPPKTQAQLDALAKGRAKAAENRLKRSEEKKDAFDRT